jgi:hypothetical protein
MVGITVAVLSLLLVACSGSSDARHDTTGGSGGGGGGEPTDSTSTTADPRVPGVLDGYDAYWIAVLAAADPPDPDNSQLADHASGDELDRVRSMLTDLAGSGDVMRGSYGHDASVRSIDGDSAVVADCLAPRTTILDAATGQVTVGETTGWGLVTAHMVLDGEVWKVAQIEAAEEACSPGAG